LILLHGLGMSHRVGRELARRWMALEAGRRRLADRVVE
jgi:hypothetical protein